MKVLLLIFLCLNTACSSIEKDNNASSEDTLNIPTESNITVSEKIYVERKDTNKLHLSNNKNVVKTDTTTPAELVAFAKTLIGTPYLYASSNPEKGFDCSGFITYVFNQFSIKVPRSTVDFTDVGTKVPLNQAKPGDLILFTGTDSTIRVVGHMGIITNNSKDSINFIHSTSGRKYGVTITALNDYYMGRFVKVIRVFDQNKD